MAADDDPYAKYLKPPGSQAAPTPTAPAAAAPDPGADPYSKYLANPPASSSGTKPATYDDTTAAGLLGDTAYRAADTGTLGALDYGLAGLHAIERGTGYDPNATDLATIHKQNEEWQQNHPYIALGADVAGYTLGAGKLGIGAKIAGRIGEGALARVAGSAIENAGASAISEEANTAGQANVGDLLKHAAMAGTVGGATGFIPGQKGARADAASPTKDLGAATERAFKPLETTHYNPSDVASDFNSVSLSAKNQAGISDSLDTQIAKTSKAIADKQKAGQSVTADDLTNFQIDINKAAQGRRDIPIAKAYNDAIDQTMATTKPLYSPLGGPSAISAASDTARDAALKKNVSSDIDDWITRAQRGDVAGTKTDIQKSLDNNPNFYLGGVGPLLQKAAQPPRMISKLGMAATRPALDAAVGAGTGYLFGGQDLSSALLEGAATGIGGAAVRHGLSQSQTNNLVSRLAQARHLNANPGSTVSANTFNPGVPVVGPMGAYARQSGLGLGVSNLFSQ